MNMLTGALQAQDWSPGQRVFVIRARYDGNPIPSSITVTIILHFGKIPNVKHE